MTADVRVNMIGTYEFFFQILRNNFLFISHAKDRSMRKIEVLVIYSDKRYCCIEKGMDSS